MAYALIGVLGYLGLVWADTAKQATHALIMSMLLLRYVGPLRAHMGSGLTMIGLGATTMFVAMLAIGRVIEPVLPAGTFGDLLLLVVVGGSGVVAYVFPLVALGMPEMRDVIGAARARLAQRR